MHDFPAAQSIFLKCVDQEGLIILFKIKPTTPLWKLTNAFCRRFGFDPNRSVFLVDGDPLRHIDTALSLGLEDGDYIDMQGPFRPRIF